VDLSTRCLQKFYVIVTVFLQPGGTAAGIIRAK
jgi:hypothetical protein